MQTQLQDMKDLLKSTVIINETAEGEKKHNDTNAIPALTQREHTIAENITPPEPSPETQGELAYKESTLPVSETKVNEESAMVLYNPKKDLVDLTTTKQDSDDDDDIKTTLVQKIQNHASHPQQATTITTLKAQAQKWTEHEAKKAKMMEEYNHQISFRADKLPITKISYVVNFRKEATMKITKGDNPLNLIVHPNFRLKQREWLEVHALASKKSGPSNNLLLQSLRAKFQWIINQAKRLGLPLPPELATFGLTAEEKKRKRAEFFKEMFVTEDVRVDGMNINLIHPPGVVPIEGLVIKEPESGIFYMNMNTDVVFQRESEFHLTPTVELIRIQNQIKVNSEIASEMYRSMNYVIEARADCIAAKKTVQENLDNLG
ncbi:hypothetical protein Tco_0851147 [Tanacetum coccineum]